MPSSSLVVMGSCMYWFTRLGFRPKGQGVGQPPREMTILMFGELHKQIEYGCTRRIPLCIGDFCFSDKRSAQDAKWVHRYIVDVLLDEKRHTSESKTLFFVENPKESFENREVPADVREAYPTLASMLEYRGDFTFSGDNAHKERKLVNEIRDLLGIVFLEEESWRGDAPLGADAEFFSDPCGLPSALTAIRSEVNDCGRAATGGASCPVDSRRIIVDHFDCRMIKGAMGTVINPFPLLLRCFSFLRHMFGACPEDGSDWSRTKASADTQSQCLHYILGPASPLPASEWKECARYVKERVVGDYLQSRYDPLEKRYVPAEEDENDRQAVEALGWISEYGDPRRVVELMNDMFKFMHSGLGRQKERTERVFGKPFVASVLRAYCHYNANVYTKPQIRNAFHALWITGLGERMSKLGSGSQEEKTEVSYYGRGPSRLRPAPFRFQHPYFTRRCQIRAARIARLINAKSSLTDSITDVTMLLRILEAGGSGECDRAVVYGGMAHTKNISRFFSFLADGVRALPSYCVAGAEDTASERCKCSDEDLKNVREQLLLRDSRGVSTEYCYPEPGQYVVIEGSDRDEQIFFGEKG